MGQSGYTTGLSTWSVRVAAKVSRNTDLEYKNNEVASCILVYTCAIAKSSSTGAVVASSFTRPSSSEACMAPAVGTTVFVKAKIYCTWQQCGRVVPGFL